MLNVRTTRGCCHAGYKRLLCLVTFNNSTMYYLLNSLRAKRSCVQRIYRMWNQCNTKQSLPLYIQSVAVAEGDLTFDVPVMSVPRGQQPSQACNCTEISHIKTGHCTLSKISCKKDQRLKLHTRCFSGKKKKSGMNILPLYSVDTHRELIFID